MHLEAHPLEDDLSTRCVGDLLEDRRHLGGIQCR